jgi:ferredoxin
MSKSRVLVVRIDPEKCQGHARCHALAAELFELDEFGNARVRGSGRIPPASKTRHGSPGPIVRNWRSRSSRRRRRRTDICTLTTPSVAAIIPSGIEDSDGVERLR